MSAFEANFDGLVGPTHNYAGLSVGNVASQSNFGSIARPKDAALQGLEKMLALSKLGLIQGVLPPHARPHLRMLGELGFTGTTAQKIESAWKASPPLLGTIMSASSMWTANAATVSPGADTDDGKTHFTPANLVAMPHRSVEAPTTGRILRSIFSDPRFFTHHDPLTHHTHFGDEGAANHTRLCSTYDAAGLELFVYGQCAYDLESQRPTKYPARQTLEASQAIARLHGLNEGICVFAQQNPAVIDEGVFHNDVISVGNRNVLFFHEMAYLNKADVLNEISKKSDGAVEFVELLAKDVPVGDAVTSYLFNSQLVSLPGQGRMTLIAPTEAEEIESVRTYLEGLTGSQGPIGEVRYFNLRQSMRNGGGPACLRLRVVLNDEQISSIKPRVILDEALYEKLKTWVEDHYRDEIAPDELRDPDLPTESFAALDQLTQILDIGSVYDFQLN